MYKETYKGKEKHVLFILMVLEIVSLRLSLSGVFLGSLSLEVYYRHHTSGLGEMVDGKGTRIPFWNIHMGGLSSRMGNWRWSTQRHHNRGQIRKELVRS